MPPLAQSPSRCGERTSLSKPRSTLGPRYISVGLDPEALKMPANSSATWPPPTISMRFSNCGRWNRLVGGDGELDAGDRRHRRPRAGGDQHLVDKKGLSRSASLIVWEVFELGAGVGQIGAGVLQVGDIDARRARRSRCLLGVQEACAQVESRHRGFRSSRSPSDGLERTRRELAGVDHELLRHAAAGITQVPLDPVLLRRPPTRAPDMAASLRRATTSPPEPAPMTKRS